jgi:hypothetical protein
MNSLSVPQNLFFEDDDYDKSSYEKKKFQRGLNQLQKDDDYDKSSYDKIVPTRTKPAPQGRWLRQKFVWQNSSKRGLNLLQKDCENYIEHFSWGINPWGIQIIL